MTLSVVVLTADEPFSRYIGIKKTGLVPVDLRRHEYFARNLASVSSYFFYDGGSAKALGDYLESIGSDSTSVVLLFDQRLAEHVRPYEAIFFTCSFDHSFGGKNAQNYMGMVLNRVLRAFLQYSIRFDDEKTERLSFFRCVISNQKKRVA